MKLEFSVRIFEKKNSNIDFHQNPSSGSRVVPCGKMYMKLIVAFCSYAKTHKNQQVSFGSLWKLEDKVNFIHICKPHWRVSLWCPDHGLARLTKQLSLNSFLTTGLRHLIFTCGKYYVENNTESRNGYDVIKGCSSDHQCWYSFRLSVTSVLQAEEARNYHGWRHGSHYGSESWINTDLKNWSRGLPDLHRGSLAILKNRFCINYCYKF